VLGVSVTSNLRLLDDSVTSSEDKEEEVDESSSEESDEPSNEISSSNENTARKMSLISTFSCFT